jgi:Protein of unknown function (DUF3592)
MTLSTPQKDRRMMIPSGTIVEEAPSKMRFGYFRSWIVSLLALVLLPVGGLLILVGTAIASELDRDWVATTAEVTTIDDTAIMYTWQLPNGTQQNGRIARTWNAFVKPTATGDLAIRFSLCDIASLALVSPERGADFTLYYDANNPSNVQCVPITEDWGIGYFIGGWVLVIFSLLTLLRVFHRAAGQ